MSGGVAYVLDEQGRFANLVNKEMVELEELSDPDDQQAVLELVRKHVEYTGSTRGRYVLDRWPEIISKFVKVMPRDYKRALAELKKANEEAASRGVPVGELQEVANG
jgi:glutamate synthase (ferredoxin)